MTSQGECASLAVNPRSAPRRRWTAEEDDRLRAGWNRGCVAKFAKQLGRSKAAVMQRASVLGLAQYHRGEVDPQLADFIRQQHADGMVDTQIHRLWLSFHPDKPITRERVCYVRRRFLKLGRNEDALKRIKRAAYETQLRTLGVRSVSDLSRRHWRRQAIRKGWPPELSPSECRIADLMLDGRFRTRAEIAAALGWTQTHQRCWFKTKRGSQSSVSNLLAMGLLRRTAGRTRKGHGKGRTAYEYWMPLDVIRARPKRRMAV